MNTNTGELAMLELLSEDEKINGQWKEIDPANLSKHRRRELEANGRTMLSRNSPCPCGSRKRFKRCCMTEAK